MYVSDVEITYTWNNTTCQWEETNIIIPDKEDITSVAGQEKNTWTVTAKNRAQISELSGHVWIDEPQGEKGIQGPNGKYDMNEKFKAGVQVYLYQTNGTQVTEDGYGNTYGTNGCIITDASGAYKFENIEKKQNVKYYILFKYDGINYIRTINGDSKAAEIPGDRTTFNGKFKTISAGTSNGGVALNYSYDGNGKSTLITEDNNGVVLANFEMKADTQTAQNTYDQKATDIDLGLRPKTLDLSLMMDIYDAQVSINGLNQNPNDLKYNKIFDGDMNLIIDISQGKTAGTANYNMNLYRSDYKYRIGDYMGNNPAISHQPGLDADEQQAFENDKEELTVTIKYILVLNNQSITEAQVESVDYYYDSHLTFNKITGGTATNAGNNKLTIVPTNKNLPNGGQSKIELEFTLKLDNLDSQPALKNTAEITKYSTTEGGFVDCDSAPGNGLNGNTVTRYEDDCDESNALKINVSVTDREISGYVFEDNKNVRDDDSGYLSGNGKYDAGETKVNDVIVQLIEIKNLQVGNTMHRLEYIWQETTSGSNVVKKISDDGKSIEQYQVAAETGKYTFKGFIPGNYIVRFIYGDGTYYDTAISADNILKYNGLAYKSTTDANYTKPFLVNSSYSGIASMARDNEARRLEIMKYALKSTDSSDLKIDSKAKLASTWMPADTSVLPVVDIVITSGKQAYTANANFGLVARPVTKIALRKHIGFASIKGGNGNLNVEASADINRSYSDESVTVANLSKIAESNPLTAQATTRHNRGYWQVEANDIEGANLQITYKYRVTNIGEVEYLHNDLASKFTLTGAGYDEDVKNYIAVMDARISEVNKSIKKNSYNIETSYLGEAYYTGKKGNSDKEVASYVHLEDYLSNEFTVDPASDLAIVSENVTKKVKDISGNDDTEKVRVLQTKNGAQVTSGDSTEFKLILKKNGLSASDSLSYPSYIAQVIVPTTNLAGTKVEGTTANNLPWVQAYAKMATLENLNMEEDEYWAETFQIVPTTGEDKQSESMLVYGIVGGLAVIAVGIVLIKKFIIK